MCLSLRCAPHCTMVTSSSWPGCTPSLAGHQACGHHLPTHPPPPAVLGATPAGSPSRGPPTAARQGTGSCFHCVFTAQEPTSCGQIFSLLPLLPIPGFLCLFDFINLVGDTDLSVSLTCFPSNTKLCHHLKCLLAINLSEFVKYVLCIVSSFPWLARLSYEFIDLYSGYRSSL